eukprot:CAMPEP_0179351946 /NCGR_PEP_ID=MMETSP0797-20121207/75548_1 /TAXON_ID=47934 /ORGANISM="Dinophysis acuminata, Strain DAEP01" /LENGTH=38 /DNA_ID= /DNA_START= /DNA_END= /DNA_ORIENTATION=
MSVPMVRAMAMAIFAAFSRAFQPSARPTAQRPWMAHVA